MLTLKELKGNVKRADLKTRIPSVKWILASGGEVVVKERLNELTEVSVYDSGYFDKKNTFDVERFISHELVMPITEEFVEYEVELTEEETGKTE